MEVNIISKTRKRLNQNLFIWVQCDFNIISNRILEQEERPLLKNKNILDTLIEKNKERIEFYRQADSRIVNDNSNIEMTVEAFVKDLLLKKVIYK